MMDQKYFAEIKARERVATPGPWRVGDEIRDTALNGKNTIVGLKGNEVYVVMDRAVYPNENKFNEQVYADIRFATHARTDIPALIAEVERLTAENQGLRANSMIQEHIISGGRDPIKDGEIMRLIMDNAAKDQQIADLKESKEVIENDLINANMNLEHAEADNATLKKALDIAGQYVAAHAGNLITETWPERFIKIAQAQQTHETHGEAEK